MTIKEAIDNILKTDNWPEEDDMSEEDFQLLEKFYEYCYDIGRNKGLKDAISSIKSFLHIKE